ncbi:cation transporter, partial [Neorhizobium sp. BETTINA12A]|uniref:cation transporter n=1 Tax=Neorhizobium sp. BETTINA12A TaxID=2908924 RepID=UPI001FF19A1E
MNQTVKPIHKAEPFTVPVEGMTCASCVRRVENAAAKVAGIDRSAVNFATKKLTVESAEGFSPEELTKAIRKVGYEIHPGAMDHAMREAGMMPPVTLTSHAGHEHHHGHHQKHQPGHSAPEAQVHMDHAAMGHDQAAGHAGGHDHMHMHRGEEGVLKRDLAIAFVLTLPLFVLEMAGHLYDPFHHWLMGVIETQNLYYLYFLAATLVVFGPGFRFLKLGLPALLRGAPEMNSLVAVGVLAAYGYSLVTTFAPDLLPESARFVYYEAATVIVTLILFGRLLE